MKFGNAQIVNQRILIGLKRKKTMKNKLKLSLIFNNVLLLAILVLMWIMLSKNNAIHKQYLEVTKEAKNELREFRGIWNTVCTQLLVSAQINIVQSGKRKRR